LLNAASSDVGVAVAAAAVLVLDAFAAKVQNWLVRGATVTEAIAAFEVGACRTDVAPAEVIPSDATIIESGPTMTSAMTLRREWEKTDIDSLRSDRGDFVLITLALGVIILAGCSLWSQLLNSISPTAGKSAPSRSIEEF
jgi:hypothetical protein